MVIVEILVLLLTLEILSLFFITDADIWFGRDTFYFVKEVFIYFYFYLVFFFHKWVLIFVSCLFNICEDHKIFSLDILI